MYGNLVPHDKKAIVGQGREFVRSDYFFPRTQSKAMSEAVWASDSFLERIWKWLGQM